ncbi:unnamed protein product [Onchocerca ochengi]|uniref:Uncharacterized protein n=1 Tax=Onchocerca ochengi TaxID=42157 RepID=A0A182E639_ONCOC|nr:unnamed protein product [Onchocerca ochengi]
MIIFFTFIFLLVAITQSSPLENLRLISAEPSNNVHKLSWRAPRLKRHFGGCGQMCCCAAVCCCAPRFVPPPPPPPSLPPVSIPPPVCCQISTRICCQPPPQVIQPPPVCCTQVSQALVPQHPLFPPQPIPMMPSQMYPSLQIGRQPCCNCCSCSGSGHGRKRRSHSFRQYKLTILK